MKKVVKIVAVAAVLVFLGQGVFASDKGVHDQNLHDDLCELGMKIKEEIHDILDEYRDLSQTNQALKDAGASYQHALTAGERDLSIYTIQKQQAAMSGMYTFDAGYAALFLRKNELASFLEARKNLNEKIGFTMPLSPKMKYLIENPESIKDFSVWTDAFDSRFDLIGDVHNLMLVSRFTQREVDGIRNIIGPERQAILDGNGR